MSEGAEKKRSGFDLLIKLLLIGDSGVGKSCLLVRFADDSFQTNFIPTIGIDFKVKTLMIDGKKIKLQIWDTAGQERFRTITQAYYRGAMGTVLVYDVCDEPSFQNVRHWMKQIEVHASSSVNKILVGNKSDMSERVITTERGAALAKDFGVKFFETSAKLNTNVSDAFVTIARDVVHRVLASAPTPPPLRIIPEPEEPTTTRGPCCGGGHKNEEKR